MNDDDEEDNNNKLAAELSCLYLLFNLSVSSTADDERSSSLPGRTTVVAFLGFAALTAEAGDVETREEVDRWSFYASEARRSTRLDSRKLNSL
jgi:hypothetical protein